ncbi:hypothetical protein AGDE_14707 [Angomonas deanei]|nr:hypothetical protein AGDE_14707 [Angomonas deanei]|eukprot:EPY20384.1 hypothetical protein AGDE_14707 [Angomonas deanei]
MTTRTPAAAPRAAAAKAAAVKKPTQAAQPQKRVYEEDSDDGYDSSSTDYSDNSEEFRPLAFELYKGGADRHSGAPAAHRVKSMRFSGKEFLSDSDEENEIPMMATTERNRGKRHCGRVKSDLKKMSESLESLSSELGQSSTSNPLPVELGRRKRARSVGHANQRNPETVQSQKEVLTDESDADEAPLNSDVILNLVRRLRTQPIDDIPLEAFQNVNWGDDNYQEELKPLRAVYLEIKARQMQSVGEKNITRNTRSSKIAVQEAIEELPAEKAIVAKIAKIEHRNISALPNGSVFREDYFNGNADPAGDGRKNRDINLASGKNPSVQKAGEKHSGAAKPSSRAVTAEMNTPACDVKKMRNSLILQNGPSRMKSEEATFSEEAKKVRKTATKKKNNNRSLTFSEVLVPETTEEIHEKDEDLAPVEDGGAKPTSKGRKTRPDRATNGVGFRAAPEDDAPENLKDDGTLDKRKPKQRRGKRKPGGSCVSFTEVPDDGVSELNETDTGLDKNKKSAPKIIQRRTKGKRANGRSCSFSDVALDEVGEIKEDPTLGTASERGVQSLSATAPKQAGPLGATGAAFRNRSSTQATVAPAKTADRRRRTVDNGRALNYGEVDDTGAGELNDNQSGILAKSGGKNVGKAANTGRRQKSGKGRSREISISQLADDHVGEIVEDTNATNIAAAGKGPARAFQPSTVTLPTRQPPKRQINAPAGIAPEKPSTQRAVPSVQPSTSPPRARRPGKHRSREFSFSALPDEDVAGEIKESFTDSLEHPSMRANVPRRTLPSIQSSVSRSGNTPLPRKPSQQTVVPTPQGTFVEDTVNPNLPQRKAQSVPNASTARVTKK